MSISKNTYVFEWKYVRTSSKIRTYFIQNMYVFWELHTAFRIVNPNGVYRGTLCL